jgi:hypothetical protein
MNSKIKYVAIALIALLSTVTVAVSAQYVMNSNILNHPVSAQATLVLAQNSTSSVVGDGVRLTATCSDTTFTGTVTFLDGVTTIGTANAVAGVATLDYTTATAKTYQFQASATHN